MKIIKIPIKSLKTTYTYDDIWLKNYQKQHGDSVITHPNYKAIIGNDVFLQLWFNSLGLDWKKQMDSLLELLDDIKNNGIKKPIKIYKDYRINTGHKRAAIALFLGYSLIEAEIISDDTKL